MMESILKSKVAETFRRNNFSEEDAQFLSDILYDIDERQQQRFEAGKALFLVQKDKVEIIEKTNDVRTELLGRINDVRTELLEKINDVRTELLGRINDVRTELLEKINDVRIELLEKINAVNRSIYIVGLVQFLAIIASMLAIVNFMLK